MLTGAYSAKAQVDNEKDFTNIASINDSVFLKDCWILIDSFNSLKPGQVMKMGWKPLSSYKIKSTIPANWITKRVYLQLNLFNNDSNATTVYFYPGLCYKGFKTTSVLSNYLFEPLQDLSQKDGFQPITIPAYTKQTFIVELNFTKTGNNYLLPQIINKDYLVKYQKILYYGNEIPTIVGQGLPSLQRQSQSLRAAAMLLRTSASVAFVSTQRVNCRASMPFLPAHSMAMLLKFSAFNFS